MPNVCHPSLVYIPNGLMILDREAEYSKNLSAFAWVNPHISSVGQRCRESAKIAASIHAYSLLISDACFFFS
jgi:hypothetical protein